jgi:cation:H+ antiporter
MLITTIVLFLVSAAAIYWACEYFVNGIEWLGKHLNLGAMAIGAVLAAFGTALPESSVTLLAVLSGHGNIGKDLGVGAALGGPLALGTLAYAAVGVALLCNRRSLQRENYSMQVDHRTIGRDQLLFILVFIVKILLGWTSFRFKGAMGWLFLAVYVWYVIKKMNGTEVLEDEGELEPLRFRRGKASTLGWAALQSFAALAVIAAASRIFVMQLESLGVALHWPAQMTALLLSPIATELPEVLNALIWVRQGKERLALANISGAMMIQATVPSALGLFFTPWLFDHALSLSALLTLAAVIYLWLIFRRSQADARLVTAAFAFYGIFAVLLAHDLTQRWERIPAEDKDRVNPVSGQPSAIAAGAALYRNRCQVCHRAAGYGGKGPVLRNTRLHKATDGEIEWILRQGMPEKGMPSWGGLTQEDRWRVVAYLKSLQ